MNIHARIKFAEEALVKKYNPSDAFGKNDLIKLLHFLETLYKKRFEAEQCNVCDREGEIKERCFECNGTGKLNVDCNHNSKGRKHFEVMG